MISIWPIRNVVGFLLMLVGVMMLCCIPFSIYFEEQDTMPLLTAAGVTLFFGFLIRQFKPKTEQLAVRKREGYLIVACGWLAMVLFSALPYLFSGLFDNPVDAFFESISGMTTTGASIIEDIEAMPKGILFWRSLTQWIGGMGIIVLTVALFPLLGIGGIELFVAEAPGPTSDKIHPRIQQTAKSLWLIYVSLTGILMFILWGAGMTFYDAINHALTTMATGGFSTHNASLAAYNIPQIQYPIIFFMFLAGVNYTVIYWSLQGKLKRVWASDEFKVYVTFIFILGLAISVSILYHTSLSFEESIRTGFFQVISLVTTTGYVSADYTAWGPGTTMIFFGLLFVGASAGSTSGGIKLVRHWVFLKNTLLEFRRLIHPRAVLPIKMNGQVVNNKILSHILVFLLLYLALFILGTFVVSIMGLDFETATSSVATALGNVGPGLGKVGPTDNFAWLPNNVKITLSFLMLLGRLELFTILILFTPYFWKSN